MITLSPTPTTDRPGEDMITEQRFKDLERAAEALARDLSDCLAHAIEARGHGVIAVSGGRTPAFVFKHLREVNLDWSRITVTLTDERWVPETDPASNAAMVRRELLAGPAAAATFVPLYGGEPTPDAGHEASQARLRKLSQNAGNMDQGEPKPIFDATYLGMGEDGHVASLFPGDPEVETNNGLCIPVPARSGRAARMSLTAQALRASRALYLLYSGTEKHAQYLRAKQPGPIREIPLRLLVAKPGVNLKVLSTP